MSSKVYKLVREDELTSTFECETKTVVHGKEYSCMTEYTVWKDMPIFAENCTQEDYEKYIEIKRIRAQDADRTGLKEQDPSKKLRKRIDARLKDMNEQELEKYAKEAGI